MSVRERALRLTNDEGLAVRIDVRLPDGPGPFPCAVILHGFKGFKDWGMWPPTAMRLAERGLASVALNSSRNGVGEGLMEFTELESFARNTPRREAKDVALVLDAIRRGEVDAALDGGRLGLLGHSRGGGIMLLVASRDPAVRAVVTWAAIAKFDRWTSRAKAEWRARGRIDVPNARTGQILWLEREVLEDLEASRAEYDLEAACRALRAPLLVVHGELDDAVDPEDAERLVAWAGSPEKRLLRIPRTGHTFGAAHPWGGPPDAWGQAVDATADWLTTYL
ncbi:MAG: prolyl oligopeptidase family serine peptidase [bacterium]